MICILATTLVPLLPLVDMAKQRSAEYQINLFVPDLHSFTTPIDHGTLAGAITQNLRMYAAAGLPHDNPDVHIYRQSYVPAHSELTWILDCFTGFGEMNRMTQFKDKSAAVGNDRISLGLFNYPVLMAADILLYGASYVPVGADQTQHLEYTRDIAERLNNQFGDLFIVPKAVKEQHEFFGADQGLRIKDLADPTKKMSKSDASGKGVIFLTDSAEQASAKIMAATTDSLGKIAYDAEQQPGVTNLLDILKLLGGNTAEFIGQSQYGSLKTTVASAVADFLTNFQARLSQVDETIVLAKLAESETLMNQQANATLQHVQKAVGLRA